MNRKITFFKKIDAAIGPTLISVFRLFGARRLNAAGIRSILFIRPGGIGDAVLLLPAINLLKTGFPDAHIDVLCEKRNGAIFGLTSAVKRIYLYDRSTELIDCLRNEYDAVVDSEQWHRLSAVVAGVTRAPLRIGFDTNDRRRMFTNRIPYSHDDYEVYSFLRLLEPLSVISSGQAFDLSVPFVRPQVKVLPELLPPASEVGEGLVALFPGASVRERRWGGGKFGKVAAGLTGRGYKVVVVGSAGDRNEADEIRKHSPSSIDLTGKTSLVEVAAVLIRCRLLITADSGLMHIACAIGIPTVSLFGSGIEKKWAPRGSRHAIINKRLSCSPCTRFGYTPACRRGIACLSLISPDEVMDAAEKLLAGGRPGAPRAIRSA